MTLLIALLTAGIVQAQAPAASLRIVVVDGEDAVNIVQQKTAVRPLVEVRDANNLPVPGASVTFTVGSGQPAAFAGGAPAMTVTTNANGQAAATGFNATGAGKVTIQVQAVSQGQVAAATIAQTNFLTAAAAAAAGVSVGAAAASAGGAGAAVGAGAAGAGGGLSATTIAIIGGAVAGGAVIATQSGVLGGDDGEEFDVYQGTFSGQYVFTTVRDLTCHFTNSITGTLTIDLRTDRSGGKVGLVGSSTGLSVSGGCIIDTQPRGLSVVDTQATGGPTALAFTVSQPQTSPTTEDTTRISFTGAHAGDSIAGSITFEFVVRYFLFPGTGTGSITMPITLTRMGGR